MNIGGEVEKYYLPGKDGWHNHDVVGESYREAQIVSALGRRPRLDEEIEEVFEASLVPEPDNPHDANAISVRVNGHVVGYLDRSAAQLFRPIIHRIAASGLAATTSARIWAVVRESWDDNGAARFFSSVRVYLPEPHQIIPLNSRAQENVAVLPWGGALQVTGEDVHFSHLFNYVPENGEGLVILTMHRFTHTLKNGTEKELVEVRLDGERVGQLTAASSNHYLPTLDHAADSGKLLGIWARLKGSGLAAELVIQGAKATELNDQWLRIMPVFPRLVPAATAYAVQPSFMGDSRARQVADTTQRRSLSQSTVGRQRSVDAAGTAPQKSQKSPFVVSEKERRLSPRAHRRGGVVTLFAAILVGCLLAAIPFIGPILLIGCLILGIMGNVRSRRIAAVLEDEGPESRS